MLVTDSRLADAAIDDKSIAAEVASSVSIVSDEASAVTSESSLVAAVVVGPIVTVSVVANVSVETSEEVTVSSAQTCSFTGKVAPKRAPAESAPFIHAEDNDCSSKRGATFTFFSF
ncbi:TPA: hypothetical protein ACGOON_000229 [Streptococcus suis]